MKIIYTKNYDEMSKKACELVVKQINEKKNSILGLATGSTPLGLYEKLIKEYKNGLDFSEISTYNLDEYIGLSEDNDQSYNYFMNENLFKHINVNKENINIPSGINNPEKEIDDYENKIRDIGGVDLQILGLGSNGHIAFNEPSEELNAKTSIVELTESTIKANSRFFEKESDVPTKAISMGIGTIFTAKKIIILISGKNKEQATDYLLNSNKISTNWPVSLLQLHQDTTVIIDESSVGVK
ncbi:glucosamine-6-phosphate deaminase [Miniphocaeibacter halophilus]|uniref:Glucosamine-6-phosphate deaminase n=1 Tax=Miniphocaeibacter halophilus TaxID=2931922 RepID=A0AC61MUA2_9FIRM|nr:glucosamine-6-phosphate deaminase [Miniphocaeibacter halophilus]QQK07706.1 glucosamine-6-phosphate deaminase [Miniphocaeibacter halophilus]